MTPRHLTRGWMLVAGFALAACIILGRAFQLQALEHQSWSDQARQMQQARVVLHPERGSIYDRFGRPMVQSQETYRIQIAPEQLQQPDSIRVLLTSALGLSGTIVDRAVDPTGNWLVIPGFFSADQRRALGEHKGIYYDVVDRRVYPLGDAVRSLIGPVSADGLSVGGLEREFDAELRGHDGFAVVQKRGAGMAMPSLPSELPIQGSDLYLTIDSDLQAIADQALRESIDSAGAEGGDIIMTDPWTGEILASVSYRKGQPIGFGTAIEPYEPGSTIKPFTVATLLQEKLARVTDSVYAEQGKWTDPTGRVIEDVEQLGWLSLADALKHSSNIAIAKFAARIPAKTQYLHLRDFGFGSPTAIAYPGEASGVLRRPSQWSVNSNASLAIGYELSVTPLQMAMAYGAIANGGVLMEPKIVRAQRKGGNGSMDSTKPRAVRRVMPEELTHQMTGLLEDVVNGGTATRAQMGGYAVAGKTGTAKIFEHGTYSGYVASFAGFFPADRPQLVFLVKLIRPTKGGYTGGMIAAPVMRRTLEAALASRSGTIDRLKLEAPTPGQTVARHDPPPPPQAESAALGPFVLPAGGIQRIAAADAPRRADTVSVPDLSGTSLREAARQLHALGLRAEIVGSNAVTGTLPAAGTLLRRGDAVRVVAGAPR